MDEDGKTCGFDICTSREILTINGDCERCEAYYRPDEDGKKCI